MERDFKKTVVEVVDALQAVVDAMRRFDAARMRAEIDAERRVYAAIEHLRRLLQDSIHEAGRPDGLGVSLEFVKWPPGAEAVRKAVLSINDIPPLSWDSEVFAPTIPGSTERLIACSLSRFAGVLATLEALTGPVELTADDDAKPVWDTQTGILMIDGQEAKRIRNRKQAKNHLSILDAFQEEGWPARIDTPFSHDTPQKFHQTILSLNKGLRGMRFHADGSGGEGITWERSKDGQRTVN